MGVTLQPGDELCVVRLHDSVTVNCAVELQQALIEALSSGKPVHIDWQDTTEMDVSAIQLLAASRRHAAEGATSLSSSNVIPEAVANAFRLCGLDPITRIAE